MNNIPGKKKKKKGKWLLRCGAIQARSLSKNPCGRVGYTIIPLNVPDFYKYRTSVIGLRSGRPFFIFRNPAKAEKGKGARATKKLGIE